MTATPRYPRPMPSTASDQPQLPDLRVVQARAILAELDKAFRPLQEALLQLMPAITHANEQLAWQANAFADALRQTKVPMRP